MRRKSAIICMAAPGRYRKASWVACRMGISSCSSPLKREKISLSLSWTSALVKVSFATGAPSCRTGPDQPPDDGLAEVVDVIVGQVVGNGAVEQNAGFRGE